MDVVEKAAGAAIALAQTHSFLPGGVSRAIFKHMNQGFSTALQGDATMSATMAGSRQVRTTTIAATPHDKETMTMHTTYRLNVNELDEKFIQSLKTLFKDKEIEILVSEVDETAYLLRSKANRERLLRAIENIEKGENLVEVRIGDLQ